jgi:hypothetical protein
MDVRAILNNLKPMFGGYGKQRIHVREPHRQVDGNDGSRAWGDRSPGIFYIQAVRFRIDVAEDGHAARE